MEASNEPLRNEPSLKAGDLGHLSGQLLGY